MINRRQPVTLTEEELVELRRELRASLRRERIRTGLSAHVSAWLIARGSPALRLAAAGAVPLLAGLIVGYAVFDGEPAELQLPLRSAAAAEQSEQGATEIADVRFLDADPESGMIEFSFEAVRPVRVRGNIHDREIQRILARALLDEENAGVRIRTVNAIASSAQGSIDPKTKLALLTTMKEDANPGVRKEALKALQNLPMDDEIRDALIAVLVSDENEGMRIDAINSLTALDAGHPAVGEKLISVLQRRMEKDHNNYIRLRAEAMLKEVQQ